MEAANQTMDLDTIQRIKQQLTEIQPNDTNASDDQLIRECLSHLQGKVDEIIQQYSDVSALGDHDFDTYLENLKGELSSVEAENAKLSDEVENLMKGYLEDSKRLQSNLEGLDSSLELIRSQEDLETKRADAHLKCSSLAEHQPDTDGAHAGCKFKILELSSKIENKREILKTLENLDYTFKRCEGVLKIEDALTGLKVIEYDGNQIRLSLRTYIPETDLPEQNHELAIELLDGTLELRNAEIFPNDVYIGEAIEAAKSFAHQDSLLPMPENKNSLELFVRKIQDRIVLSTLRKSLVKAASKSRLSIEYEDKDEMIMAHMVDGVDAFIKVPQGWPIANSALKLLSLKGSSQSSKEVTLSFICQVESNGDLNGAEEYYFRATQADPKDGETLMQYARLVWELHHDQERALGYFEAAVLASPEDCDILGAYARFLWEIDDDEENDETTAPVEESLEEYYKRVVNEKCRDPLLLRNYAHFLQQTKGDLEGAEECYSRAVEADPKDGEVVSQYAKLVWELHRDRDKASAYFIR